MVLLTNAAHWRENQRQAWRELINAAGAGNMAKFRNLYNKGPFNSWGIGGLGGAWERAKENAGTSAPKPPKVPSSLNDFKIANGKYKLGNSVYTKLIRRSNAGRLSGNVFVKGNNKTTFYGFAPASENWQGSFPASFYKLGTANRPPIVNGNTGYKTGHGGQSYKVARYANGYNFWVQPANK
jgi:hypothetical protein